MEGLKVEWLMEQLRLLRKRQFGTSSEQTKEERVCPQCGELMQEIGTQVRETLKLIPAKAILRRDVYYTYDCKKMIS